MAQADWTELTDGLDVNTVDRGVTTGIARPNGGGSFLFGFNSLIVATGAVGYFANQVNFAPMAKGASIRAAIQRGPGGGATSFSPFLFVGGQGTSVNDSAYKLGLSDDDPHRVVLRKGSIASGAGSVSSSAGLLAQSTATFLQGTWLHLRLDMIVNDTGDVILQAFSSDLDTNAVTSPSWVALDGITEFIDDALGINSGSAPFTSGRGGFGFACSDVTRRGFVDHVELLRQT